MEVLVIISTRKFTCNQERLESISSQASFTVKIKLFLYDNDIKLRIKFDMQKYKRICDWRLKIDENF